MTSTPTDADVIVVGGGPSGVSTACRLVDAGMSVILIDKAHFPRDKCCGDGLTTSALRELESLGVDPRILPSWRIVTQTTWRSPYGNTIAIGVPNDGIRIGVVRRNELDAALLEHGKQRGVDVREGHAFSDAVVVQNEVRVALTSGDTLTSAFLVGADGAWSPVRKAVSPPTGQPYLGDIHAFRQYVTGVTGIARDQLCVSFERDILPGYFWSFPSGDGGANIGFGIERRAGKSVSWMKQWWSEALTRTHLREWLGPRASAEAPHRAWPIPTSLRASELTSLNGRVFFVGDAARAVDPLTGEGIGQALLTGRRCAEAIAASNGDPLRAASLYRQAIRRGLQCDNDFARVLARVVSHPLGAHAAVTLSNKGPQRGRYAIRWVFEDHPRARLLTPWRWKGRFTPTSGAFAKRVNNDNS